MTYIAKPNTWFKPGSVVTLIDGDIFKGVRVCESKNELHEVGEEYEDEEFCCLDEFDVIK